ncbi:hypothetical protein J6590_054233 [Homalodisca vitripennis]|nr:hypothetical protein J6590_054233 [Homalodisca vitripennis]
MKMLGRSVMYSIFIIGRGIKHPLTRVSLLYLRGNRQLLADSRFWKHDKNWSVVSPCVFRLTLLYYEDTETDDSRRDDSYTIEAVAAAELYWLDFVW